MPGQKTWRALPGGQEVFCGGVTMPSCPRAMQARPTTRTTAPPTSTRRTPQWTTGRTATPARRSKCRTRCVPALSAPLCLDPCEDPPLCPSRSGFAGSLHCGHASCPTCHGGQVLRTALRRGSRGPGQRSRTTPLARKLPSPCSCVPPWFALPSRSFSSGNPLPGGFGRGGGIWGQSELVCQSKEIKIKGGGDGLSFAV